MSHFFLYYRAKTDLHFISIIGFWLWKCILFRFQNWLLPLLFHIVKLLCSDFIAFTHFFYWFLVYGNWCKLGWSDFGFLRFSKMDTLLSIGFIFMSLIPKIGKFLSIKSGQISFIELFMSVWQSSFLNCQI